jgi:alcohol dehydrogenase class IV
MLPDLLPPPVDFGFWPGRIVAGRGALAKLPDVLLAAGGRRALVVCGGSVARGGLLERVVLALGPACAGVFSEVSAHTPVEMIGRGLAAFEAAGADSLVSVGGGSAIDAGKAIAVRQATGADLTAYAIPPGGEARDARPIERDTLPHIAVPTTAGSASDVMPTAGVRDPHTRRKLLFWDDRLVPRATVLDPEMAVATGPELTAATGMTAVARCVETIYSRGRHPISTGLALHGLRLLVNALPRSVAAPGDLDARAACQMACAMSGMAAINAMVSAVHAIGHVVGGRHALQHGISHAILLAPAMRRLLPAVGAEQRLVLEALGGTTSGDADADGRAAADRIAQLVAALPLPQRLAEVGVDRDELPDMARHAMSEYMMRNLPRAMSEGEILELLREGH